jgi:hypothetical protein
VQRSEEERHRERLAPAASLAASLPADGGFPLPLPLGAGLLVVPPLAELGIQAGALHLPLEAAERPVETLVVLNDDFQATDLPWFEGELNKLNIGVIAGNAERGHAPPPGCLRKILTARGRIW